MKKIIPYNSVLIPENAELKFHGVIYDVYQWSQKLFDGTSDIFEMLRRPDTVQVICISNDNKIIILKDEQPNRGVKLSFPGGRVDESDIDIISAAKRECLEETGYQFNKWRLVKVWQPHAKIEWFIHIFIAWNQSSISNVKHDAGEKIESDKLSFDEVKKLVYENAGYLGEASEVFENSLDLEQLLQTVEYKAVNVDR